MKFKAILTCILLSASISQAGELTGPERMLGFAKLAKIKGIEVTPEEVEYLKAIQPLFYRLSDIPEAVPIFWPTVRGYDVTDIPWPEAKEMILKGRIRSVMQAHSLTVTLQAENGAVYATKENSIDEVHSLIKHVDPMGVFIQYATE